MCMHHRNIYLLQNLAYNIKGTTFGMSGYSHIVNSNRTLQHATAQPFKTVTAMCMHHHWTSRVGTSLHELTVIAYKHYSYDKRLQPHIEITIVLMAHSIIIATDPLLRKRTAYWIKFSQITHWFCVTAVHVRQAMHSRLKNGIHSLLMMLLFFKRAPWG